MSSAVVGFGGSRSLPASFAPLVSRVVASVLASGRGVACSCASGASAVVRACAPGARVFSAASVGFRGRGAFAARAAALVRSVAASGPGSAFVAFVSVPCPAGVVPARSWRSGRPASGSWSELALAAGLGLPVFVFWCAAGPPALPSWPGFSWAPVGGPGPWSAAFRLVPAASGLPLLAGMGS